MAAEYLYKEGYIAAPLTSTYIPATDTTMEKIMSGEDYDDLQGRKAIIIGSVGSGKTSLARYVAGLYNSNNESRMSGHSVTTGVRVYRGRYIKHDNGAVKIQYTLTDTEGYGADNFSSDTLKNQLLNSLKFETDLNCIILVVSFERFRNGLKDDMYHLINLLKTLGLDQQHTIVCFTHCELFSDEVRRKYVEEFKKYYSFDVATENIIYGCFPNLSEVRDEYKDSVGENVRQSILAVREAIKSKEIPVNVAMKIFEAEKPRPRVVITPAAATSSTAATVTTAPPGENVEALIAQMNAATALATVPVVAVGAS